jgi:hypothetical protein
VPFERNPGAGRCCALTRALLVAAVLWAAGPAWADTNDRSFGERQGCDHTHPSKLAYGRIRHLVRHTDPVVRKDRVQHYATCLATRAKAHRAHELARIYWGWRHRYAQVWPIRLARQQASWVQWARNVTFCESRWDRYATNGSHWSYFQWSMPTWYAAGGTGHPYDAIWPHQAVLAIGWAQVAGTSQWVCQG